MDTNIWLQNASQSISKVNLKHRIRNQVEIEQWRVPWDVTEADGRPSVVVVGASLLDEEEGFPFNRKLCPANGYLQTDWE